MATDIDVEVEQLSLEELQQGNPRVWDPAFGKNVSPALNPLICTYFNASKAEPVHFPLDTLGVGVIDHNELHADHFLKSSTCSKPSCLTRVPMLMGSKILQSEHSSDYRDSLIIHITTTQFPLRGTYTNLRSGLIYTILLLTRRQISKQSNNNSCAPTWRLKSTGTNSHG